MAAIYVYRGKKVTSAVDSSVSPEHSSVFILDILVILNSYVRYIAKAKEINNISAFFWEAYL